MATTDTTFPNGAADIAADRSRVTGFVPADDRSWARRHWPTIVCVAAITMAHGFTAGFVDNQNTYLLRAVGHAEGGALGTDALVLSADPAPVFTALATPLVHLFDGPLGVDLVWPLFGLAFFGALWWAIGPRRAAGRLPLLLWSATLALIVSPFGQSLWERLLRWSVLDVPQVGTMLEPHLRDAVEGVALQYALGNYVQPSIAAVAAVVGTAIVVRTGRLATGIAVVLVGAVVHPSFLVAGGIVVAALVLSELWQRRRQLATSWVTFALAGVTGAVMTGLTLLLNRSAFEVSSGPDHEAANEILATQRVPHHAVFDVWFNWSTVAVLLIVLIAAVVALRSDAVSHRRLGGFLCAVTVLAVAATAYIVRSGSHTLQLTFPWRASVVAVPMATCYLLGRAASAASLATTGRRVGRALLATAAVVALAGAALSGVRTTVRTFDVAPAHTPLVRSLRNADLQGVGLIETGLFDVRINARVSVYADWKSHPIEPTEVLEWAHRVHRANRAMREPEELCKEVAVSDIGWVLVPDRIRSVVTRGCLADWDLTRIDDYTIAERPR